MTNTEAINTNSATVNGMELQFIDTNFDFLPKPFNFFGMSANLTFLDMNASNIQMNDKSFRKLPQLKETPEKTANLSLLFNYDRWSARLSTVYTGKMPRSFDSNNSANDIWFDETVFVDAQVRFKLDKHTNFIVQGKNLLNETQDRVWGPTQNIIKEQFQNGRSLYLGATYVF